MALSLRDTGYEKLQDGSNEDPDPDSEVPEESAKIEEYISVRIVGYDNKKVLFAFDFVPPMGVVAGLRSHAASKFM